MNFSFPLLSLLLLLLLILLLHNDEQQHINIDVATTILPAVEKVMVDILYTIYISISKGSSGTKTSKLLLLPGVFEKK